MDMKHWKPEHYGFYGTVTVIRRDGSDGCIFPVTRPEITFGRSHRSSIRVNLPIVSETHSKIVITIENKEARLICLSENFGQCQLDGKAMKLGSSLELNHKALFTVGDRSFRWEYPPDSSLSKLKKVHDSAKKSPKPKVLTPNNRQIKGAITKPFDEAIAVASKAIDAAVCAVIPSPKIAAPKTPKVASVLNTPSKRVSFGPYVSPELIDKTLPPSTPVRKGATPVNLSVETHRSPKVDASKNSTPQRIQAGTPSLLKKTLKKKVSQLPENLSDLRKEILPTIKITATSPENKPDESRKSSRRLSVPSKKVKLSVSPKSQKRKSETFRTPMRIQRSPRLATLNNNVSIFGGLENTSTPAISLDKFVSPMTTPRRSRNFKATESPFRSSTKSDDFKTNYSIAGKRESSGKNLKKEVSSGLRGIKNLTISRKKSPNVTAIKKVIASPLDESGNINEFKKTLAFPDCQGSPNLSGLKEMMATPKRTTTPNDKGVKEMARNRNLETPNMNGIKEVMSSPRSLKSPDLRGIKKLTEVKNSDTPKLYGMKEMLATPKRGKSPRYIGVKETMAESKIHKTPIMIGVKEMMASPKIEQSPQLGGIRQMLRVPKSQGTPKMYGVKEMLSIPKVAKSPHYIGIKEIMAEPTMQATPKMAGLKKMLTIPKDQKSPKLDGLKQMLTEPKVAGSPSYKGIKEMMIETKEKTPKYNGIKRLMALPKDTATPKMAGMKHLFVEHKNFTTPDSFGISELMSSPNTQMSLKSKENIRKTKITRNAMIRTSTPQEREINFTRVTRSGRGITPLASTSVNESLQLNEALCLSERCEPQTPISRDGKGTKRSRKAIIQDVGSLPIRTTRRKIHESNSSTAETDGAESLDTKCAESVNDMSFETNTEIMSNKRIARKKENVESVPQNSSQLNDSMKPRIKEVSKLKSSEHGKRKMQTIDLSLEVDIEPKPRKRLTRRKEIVETGTSACSKSSQRSDDMKLEIEVMPKLEVSKNSKRKRKAVDYSLEADVDRKPTKRVTRQKDKIVPNQDESHKVVAEESEINMSNTELSKPQDKEKSECNQASKPSNKGNKRKKVANLPEHDQVLTSDVEAKPAKRMTRRKVTEESELHICNTTEAARTKVNSINNARVDKSTEVVEEESTKRITRHKAAMLEKEKSKSPKKSPKSKRAKKLTASKSPPARSTRVTRSRK